MNTNCTLLLGIDKNPRISGNLRPDVIFTKHVLSI